MKVAAKSIVDSICRVLLNQHGLLVMLTRDGKPVDRSQTLMATGASAVDGYVNLPLSSQLTIAEVESSWGKILGCEVSLIDLVCPGDDLVNIVANDYFKNPEAGSILSVAPKAHFSRFRREFREVTGLGVEVMDSSDVPLQPERSLSTVGAKSGALEIGAETKCSDIVGWMKSCGLNGKVYKLQPAVDRSLSFGELLSADSGNSQSDSQSEIGCFSRLDETLDSLEIANHEQSSFSMVSPFPVFHRIHVEGEAIRTLYEQGGAMREQLEGAIDACVLETVGPGQLWKSDTLISLLESENIHLNLSKERDDVLSEISSSHQDADAAKQELQQAVMNANQCESIEEFLQTSLIDSFISIFCFAVNKAIEDNDEDLLEEWVKGFGFGDEVQVFSEEGVSDIMGELGMSHREEVVPAFMCFLKFNFGADVLPDGELRDEFGNSDWDAAITHIVESCF